MLSAFIVPGALILLFMGSRFSSPVSAWAESVAGEEGGILVIPVQVELDSYGLAMVDTVNETLWIYELSSRGPVHSRLRLLAARSWRYDKLLRQYNTAEPKPEQVRILLETLGRQRKEQSREKQPDFNKNILEIAEPNSSNFGE